MMDPPKWVRDQALKILPQNKRVLAVEGDIDDKVYTAWLRKLAAARGTIFSNRVVLVTTTGKSAILRGLEWFRDHGGNPAEVHGLVDRDEWDAATIAAQAQALPGLLVNPNRHCLESYFTDPVEIASTLSHPDAAKYSSGLSAMTARVQSSLEEWVDHWSLWVTTNRASARLRAADFPGCFHNQRPIPDDGEVLSRFQAWAGIIDPTALLQQFGQERAESRRASETERFRSRVHASDFFSVVVFQGALQSLDGFSREDWMIQLADWLPAVPADIEPILAPLLQ